MVGLLAGEGRAAEPEPILAAAQAAAETGRIWKTRIRGSDDANRRFNEHPAEGGVLIGFDVGVGKFGKIETVYALCAVYRTAQGELPYFNHGQFANRILPDNKLIRTKVVRTVSLRARPGHAVGGVRIRAGLKINGLSLTYMFIEGRKLNPSASYASEWVGDRTGGSEATVTGNGDPVVGICGSEDQEHIKSLGLLCILSPAGPAQPPPDPPKDGKPIESAKVEQPAGLGEVVPPEAATPNEGAVPESSAAAKSSGWLPFAVFGAVAVPVFLILFALVRKGQVADRDPKAADPASSRPQPPGAPDEAISVKPHLPQIPLDAADVSPVWQQPQISRIDKARAAESAKARKEVAGTLFGVAAMQFVCGLAAVSLIPTQVAGGPISRDAAATMAATVVLIAIVFAGLACWAWFQALPPALIGLVLYIGIVMLDFAVAAPNPQAMQMLMRGIIMKVLIIAALVKAVSTAGKDNGS